MRPRTPAHRLNGPALHARSPKAPMSANGCQSGPAPTLPNVDNGDSAMSDFQTAINPKTHDEFGRFAKGNPGNPFARKLAAIRRAICEAVTEDEFRALARRFFVQAQHGDMAAAKLLFGYAVGRTVEPVDPDTLDQHEWQLFQNTPVPPQDVYRILNSMPAGLACLLVSILLPNTEDKIKILWWKKMQSDMKKQERKDKRQAARAARKPDTSVSHKSSDSTE